MAELPIPNFSTLEKLFGWAGEQAQTFVRVLHSPAQYYREEVETQSDPLPAAVKFFAFVMLVGWIVEIPLNSVMWNLPIFEPTASISVIVPSICNVIAFCFLIYWFGRLFGGKGQLRHSIAGLMFASALIPIVQLADYVPNLDPQYRKAVLAGNVSAVSLPPSSGLIFFGLLLGIAVTIWTITKLVPLVSAIHSFGRIRAILVVVLVGLLHATLSVSIWQPFWAELVRKYAHA
jgi:Yip1 domain